MPPAGYNELDSLRYWGVFVVKGTSPTYRISYNYDGHPGITDESSLRLATRSEWVSELMDRSGDPAEHHFKKADNHASIRRRVYRWICRRLAAACGAVSVCSDKCSWWRIDLLADRIGDPQCWI